MNSICNFRPARVLSAMVSVLLLALPALGQPVEWTPLETPRHLHAMAYDSARGVTVRFGGNADGALNADTWEWDGAVWTLREVIGARPSPRSGQAMAYDSARGVCVVFGGFEGGTTYSAETWEWNGSVWTQRGLSLPPGSTPSARRAFAMSYDAARGVTVLFGGYNGSVTNNETWEWNGAGDGTWTRRAVGDPAPSARLYHSLAYDSARGVNVLFGGGTATGLSNEVWEWNGTVWTPRAAGASSLPTARYGHAWSYDSARGVMVLSGGTTSIGLGGNTWEWNGAGTGEWIQRATGSPRVSYHATAYDSARGVTVLFGGLFDTASLRTLEWNGSGVWSDRTPSSPRSRYLHAMAYDSTRGITVLYGGSFSGSRNSELWEWDGRTWTQRMFTGPGPGERYEHAMAYDEARGVTVLFGGVTTGIRRDTWEWNGSVWTLRNVNGPARHGHAMAYDSARHMIMMFGGRSPGFSSETYEWNGTDWHAVSVDGPVGRTNAALTYDAIRGVSVLYGGLNASGALADTWELASDRSVSNNWVRRAKGNPVPPARRSHAMVYDAARAVTVMFGGTDDGDEFRFRNDTWEWNGATWTQLEGTGPSGRLGHAGAYDAARRAFVIFGGRRATSKKTGIRGSCIRRATRRASRASRLA